MCECADSRAPPSVVRGVLCGVSCIICTHPHGEQVSNIPARPFMLSLQLCAHGSLRCCIVTAGRCSSPGSVARHRRSHAAFRCNITINLHVSLNRIHSLSTTTRRCLQLHRRKNLTCANGPTPSGAEETLHSKSSLKTLFYFFSRKGGFSML